MKIHGLEVVKNSKLDWYSD